jgi:hypothetical protein
MAFQGWFAWLFLVSLSHRNYLGILLSGGLVLVWTWFLKSTIEKWRTP